jgi:tetratricopeptide (TPR) repeat protein
MIPIIPLRRRRIIEECAACTRHGAMPLADWERAQKRADETIAAYRAKPNDTELANEALQSVAGYRNLPAFLSLAPEIEKHQAGNAKMLCILGSVYDLFGRIGDAERLCRAAYEVAEESEEDEVCDMLADTLLRQGKPDEAEPYLSHVVEKGIPDRVDGLYSLAQGWQAKGNHEKALAAFDQCELVNPLIKDDATFQRLRAESARHLGTTVVVKPGEVVRKAKSAENWRKFAKVGPVVLVLALLAYAGLAYVLGRGRSVHLLSGVNQPYRVRLNGTEYTLQPGERREVRTGEGDVKVEVLNPPAGVETGQVVSVRTPLLTRPFRSHDFVINPDGAALLSRMRVFYATENRSPSAPQSISTNTPRRTSAA